MIGTWGCSTENAISVALARKGRQKAMAFFDLLFGSKTVKADCARIAREIVALEGRIAEFEAISSEAEKTDLHLRQRKIGGDKVDAADIKKADAALHDARLNSRAATEALEALQNKLLETSEHELPAVLKKTMDRLAAKENQVGKSKDELLDRFVDTWIDWLIQIGERLPLSGFQQRADLEAFTIKRDARLAKSSARKSSSLLREFKDLRMRGDDLNTLDGQKYGQKILAEARIAAADASPEKEVA